VTFSCLVSLDGEHSENSCASLAEVTVGQDETMSADPTASERPPNKSCVLRLPIARLVAGRSGRQSTRSLNCPTTVRPLMDSRRRLETIISRLELAAPLRLPGRRKAFRTKRAQFWTCALSSTPPFTWLAQRSRSPSARRVADVDSEPDFHCERWSTGVTSKSPREKPKWCSRFYTMIWSLR